MICYYIYCTVLFRCILALYYVHFFYDNYSASTFVAIETSTSSKWLMHHGKSTRPQSPVQFKVGIFLPTPFTTASFQCRNVFATQLFIILSSFNMTLSYLNLNISGVTPLLCYQFFHIHIHLIGFLWHIHISFQQLLVLS